MKSKKPVSQIHQNKGLVRLYQIIGDEKRGIPALIPISRASWLAGVKSGIYPKPIKIGPRIIAWKVEDILKIIDA